MRVYVAACGMGLGHVGRCIPIAKRLRELGVEVAFSTYGDAVYEALNAGFRVYSQDPLLWAEKSNGSVDVRDTLKSWHRHLAVIYRHVESEVENLLDFSPNAVLSDSRVSTILAAKMLDLPVVTMLHQVKVLLPPITSRLKQPYREKLRVFVEGFWSKILNAFWGRSEAILVPDFPPPLSIAKKHLSGIPEERVKKLTFIGPVIGRRPEEYPPQAELKRRLGLPDKPLVYAGIGGTKREREALTSLLERVFSRGEHDFFVVLTRGNPGGSSPIVKRENLVVYDWVEDRYVYMKACDLVISRSGHNTVAEAIYYGKPMLLIPTPNHSEHQSIASNMEERGVARVLQQWEVEEKLLPTVRECLEDEEMRRRAEEYAKYASRFNAVEKAVSVLLRVMA